MALRQRYWRDGSVCVRKQPNSVHLPRRTVEIRMARCRPEWFSGCRIDGHIEVVTLEVHRGGSSMRIEKFFVRRREPHKFVRRSAMLQSEVHTNGFDQRFRIKLARAKRRLQPVSNRLPLVFVFDGKGRKKLSQITLHCAGNRRSLFAGERRGDAKNIRSVFSDVVAFHLLAFGGTLREIQVRARFQRDQRGWIREGKILLLVMLLPNDRIIVVIQQNCG